MLLIIQILKFKKLSFLNFNHKYCMASTWMSIHLGKWSCTILFSNWKSTHTLLGWFYWYPLKSCDKHSWGRIFSYFDLTTVLLWVDKILNHFHVNLNECTGNLKVIVLGSLHLLYLFKKILQRPRNDASLLIWQRIIRAYHSMCFTCPCLTICKYCSIEPINNTLNIELLKKDFTLMTGTAT